MSESFHVSHKNDQKIVAFFLEPNENRWNFGNTLKCSVMMGGKSKHVLHVCVVKEGAVSLQKETFKTTDTCLFQ